MIPADIAWAAAAGLLRQAGAKRGYLGVVAQAVGIAAAQRAAAGADEALLVVHVKDGSPAAGAGILVGDLLLALDGQPLASPDDLFDLLIGERVGRAVSLRVLRGGVPTDVTVTVGER